MHVILQNTVTINLISIATIMAKRTNIELPRFRMQEKFRYYGYVHHTRAYLNQNR